MIKQIKMWILGFICVYILITLMCHKLLWIIKFSLAVYFIDFVEILGICCLFRAKNM